jgi:hypothetical protein
LGSPWVASGACFHALLPIGSSTVPRPYGYELVQSSLRQTLLQSSFHSTTALTFRREQLPTWVSALFSTSPYRVHHSRELPHPHFVPSSGDHSLSTVCSTAQLVGLFHPTTESRTLSRPGVCPLHAGALLHQKNNAPLSLGTGLLICEQMATNPFPDSEALLHTKPCTLDSVVSLLAGHSPHRVLVLLQVLSSPLSRFLRSKHP